MNAHRSRTPRGVCFVPVGRSSARLLKPTFKHAASRRSVFRRSAFIQAPIIAETVLSLKSVRPELPLVSALTANHLAALILPAGLTRLYIARDNGVAGVRAAARLRDRAEAEGVAVCILAPSIEDFNEDLQHFGLARLRRYLDPQFADIPVSTAG